jgi:hypothetical protein
VSAAEEIRRGERAQAVLADPLVAEALAALERAAIDDWRATAPRNVEARERAWLMLQLAQRFRAHFESLVANGTLAKGRLTALDRERRFTRFR